MGCQYHNPALPLRPWVFAFSNKKWNACMNVFKLLKSTSFSSTPPIRPFQVDSVQSLDSCSLLCEHPLNTPPPPHHEAALAVLPCHSCRMATTFFPNVGHSIKQFSLCGRCSGQCEWLPCPLNWKPICLCLSISCGDHRVHFPPGVHECWWSCSTKAALPQQNMILHQ